jgi:predicted nucleic acid-binding protein
VLIVDTGPLVATADRADRDHEACRALLESDEGPLVTTAMVIAEAAYLIQSVNQLLLTPGPVMARRDERNVRQ